MYKGRVIMIRGDKSKWYEQAIFVIRKNFPDNQIPVDIVAEAEKIIQNCQINPHHIPPMPTFKHVATPTKPITVPQKGIKRKKSTGLDISLNVIMFLCCVIVVGLLLWTFR